MKPRGNADVIRRALAAVWPTQGRKFATFESTSGGRPDTDRWIQYLDGELNVRWPLDEAPAVALTRRGVALPAAAFPVWHAAGSNALFAVGAAPLDEVARFIEELFAKIVAEDSGDAVVSRIEDHR